MTNSRSLAARAALALLLMVGFYGMALTISGTLLWLPYAEWVYLGRVHLKLAAVCLGAAGAVLWALVPRVDRFEPPGPQLTRSNAPGLFGLIDQIARETGQAAPSEVYLLNDVNAWVTQRGGVMGFGSRRIMGVGLPLVSHLSVAELKAVIAHEFGHYVSGDVGLGPWIYKTRSAIGRALASTENTFLEMPFHAYARLFLKTTLTVSREQEFVADRTAARVAGSGATISALGRVSALAPAYSAYLNNEVTPVLRSGFLPPIAAGFDQYLEHPRTTAFMESVARNRSAEAEADEFDSHPPMAERIRALGALPPERQADASAAQGIQGLVLAEQDVHARALIRYVLGEDLMARLRPIAWQDVGEAVYAQAWRQLADHYGKWFGERTIADIPSGHKAFIQLGSALVGRDEENVNSDERIGRAVQLFIAGVGTALVSAGWTIETAPGHPLELANGSERLDPGELVGRLAKGEITQDEWHAECVRLRVAELRFGGSKSPAPGEKSVPATISS